MPFTLRDGLNRSFLEEGLRGRFHRYPMTYLLRQKLLPRSGRAWAYRRRLQKHPRGDLQLVSQRDLILENDPDLLRKTEVDVQNRIRPQHLLKVGRLDSHPRLKLFRRPCHP